MRSLACILAVRNQGSRLYAKPMQNLDVEKRFAILDYMVAAIRTYKPVGKLVLAISDGPENLGYPDFAERNNLPYVIGDGEDVLGRLIRAADLVQATDILRLTSESPFTYFEGIEPAWQKHCLENNDMTSAEFLPDGCGFEILKLSALKISHAQGTHRHRSELCTLYIRENKEAFKIHKVELPTEVRRLDLRLTVDNPEDLIVCREVYRHFKNQVPLIPLREIIAFLDARPELKKLVSKYVEPGLQTMYL